MTHFLINPSASISSSRSGDVDVRPGETASNARGPVLSVPRSQLYYWTRRWQEDEAEAVAELERGEGVGFDDPRDAIRWLLDD
jgi:hypothetical protein